jgi:tetratricopeptide (TPR) repeat protein
MKSEERCTGMLQYFLNSFFRGGFSKYVYVKHLLLASLLCLMAVTVAPGNTSAQTCEQWIAKAVSVEGKVEVKREGETQWQQVQRNETFCGGDQIRVLEESRADLSFANQPLLRLDQNTTITLAGIEEESSGFGDLFKAAAKLDLIEGAAHFFSRLPRNLEVRTGFVNAGVEGTEFFIRVADNKTFISVFEGKVLAANEAGTLPLTSGQSAVTEAGKAPVLETVVQPRDAVRWALHYPPVIDGPGPDSLVNQAAQLLSVGRVDEAGTKIKKALSTDPANSGALSLQAIIAVVQNENAEALNLADKAVAAAPGSATALIAQSYAQQSNFDLEGARASLEEAVSGEPENALAWARLAELHSSFGDLDKALDAAQKAVAINPNLSRTQTVLGFAYLTQIKTAEARESFNKAIELDQADSLPRLGLGLAKIRDGELQEGRREIEIAASLDANSSLIRSYLGKTYYEEKRPALDGREYAIAKELDPKDPTPWFYDAIRKQSINQPVEALHDLQTAIELNDNRAVYRSKLMLDADLAARSASLARIYSDLGFQQRALVEGYNSVNTDPANFSAHRFLADSYSALPRHEIARVSELLQSQLLQPANMTPIQPQLAESSLNLISSGGAASASFNEFNPLFNRNGMSLLASGIWGGNNTASGELVISGIARQLSFSVGTSRFDTDGWKENAYQEDDITNAFLQVELSPKTSVQAEFRYRDNEKGDVSLNYMTDFPSLIQEEEKETWRVGFRHLFSPSSILIGNVSYQELESRVFNIWFFDPFPTFGVTAPPFPFIEDANDVNIDQDAFSAELQQHFYLKSIKFVAGGGYFTIDEDRLVDDQLFWAPVGFAPPMSEKLEYDTDHYNLYLYSYINLPVDVNVTIGASGDFFEQNEKIATYQNLDKEEFNPKFGITWNPVPDTTIRGAVFRTFKRTLITDQTLEPTQVAGFNQFFDDGNGTQALVYGAAVDQKFSRKIFAGGEFTYRDLDEVPWFDLSTNVYEVTEWEERMGRAYFYVTPANWIALSMEYQYEKHDQSLDVNNGALEVETHSFPLGLNLFHPSGLGASFKATYWNQEGIFQRADPVGTYRNGDDTFWLVDAAINYRLPKRHGFISIGATNLFDESFEYFEVDSRNSRIQPDRVIFIKATLALP